jgi:cobalamin biosynthesis protein CobT
MGFDPAIRAKVRKLALDKKSKLTARDVLMSEELKSYLSSLAVSMGNGAGETTTIIVDDGGPDAPSGYTNGTRMYLNCTSHKLDYFDNLEGKFLGFMGTFFHEKAHDLFNDFNEFRNAMRYIDSGHFYGEKPRNMNAKQEADWTDMEDALQAPHTRQIFQTVFKDLDNIIADRHDEDSLIDAYGAFVGESLYLSRQAKQADADFFESEVHKVNTGEQDELVFMTNNMFQLCLFDEVLARSQKTVETSDYWQSIEKIQEHARIACATDDISRRFSEMNWMLLYFWPYIRNAIQKLQDQKNQQQGSSATQQNPNGSGSGNDQNQNTQGNQGSQLQSGQGGNNQQPTSSISADDVQQLLNALNKGTGNLGSNPAPQNHHSSDIAITRRANERNGKVPEKNQAGAKAATDAMSKQGKEAVYQALNSITSEIAQNQAEDELEGEASAVLVDAVTAVNDAGSHKGIKINTDRVLGVTASDVNNYNMIMEELRPVSRRLQKQMLDALRDLKDGYVQRHKQFGRTIIPSDAYRPDQRFFANKKLPQDLPDMALSVLVDHSGSMGGNRIESAMKASLLLHDFCTGLNIPIAVAGHNAERGVCVNYYIYADYEQISNKDRYRAARMAAALTKMRANNCNRDGAALTISAKLLEKRQEEVRLLIIISDGRPNDEGYGGEEAAKDIQNIVKQCKQRGIEVLACAIGDDKENIAAIYGDSFIDITDLSKLPKTLVDIVKKRIINSAF